MRQLLVSMPGQDPSTPDQQPNMWLDWHEVRKILLDDEEMECDDLAIIAARVPPAPPARLWAAARVAQSASYVGSC